MASIPPSQAENIPGMEGIALEAHIQEALRRVSVLERRSGGSVGQKKFTLSLSESISIILFVFSVGLTLGIYKKSVDDIGEIKSTNIEINRKLEDLATRSAVNNNTITIMQQDLRDMKQSLYADKGEKE